ncbi:MAG: twin-arginine translocase TatA/TatE family subunit [Gemmatimonadota bacterium]|nr:twin-arginine translocase TatA/TatE family subunit [Gemmatimonadota bacterium]
MIFDIGAGEMLVIFLIVLILFGSDRIPQLARGLGKGIRDFKRVVNGYQNEIQRIVEYEEKNPRHGSMPSPKAEDKKSEDTKAEDKKSEDTKE